MRVGILGATGPAGKAVAARLASVGITVVVGSRSADRASAVCDEIKKRWPERDLDLEPGENPEAAAADLVVVATPWDAAPETTASVAGRLAGKVVISMGNAVAKVDGELRPGTPPGGSVAAGVQEAAPEALVAAALHHVPARSLANLDRPLEGDVLVCSDHETAVDATADLMRRMPELRSLHAGSLALAAPVEAFTAVLLGINVRYKTRATVRLTGIDL